MIAVFFPCLIVLTSLTTEGNCSIQGKQLVFEKQLSPKENYVGYHDVSSCTFKQTKHLMVNKGQHIIVPQIEVRCTE
jgi:hypothetical protein